MSVVHYLQIANFILIALCGWLAGISLRSLDSTSTFFLASFINIYPETLVVESPTVHDLFSFLSYPLFTACGALCAIKAKGKSAYFTLFQLLVILLVLELLTVDSPFPLRNTVTLILSTVSAFIIFRVSNNLATRLEADGAGSLSTAEEESEKLERLNEELFMSRLQLVKSDEVDRRTLAADLHDQVLHGLKVVRQKFADYSRSGNRELVEEIDTGIAKSMDQIREVMDSLSPSALDNLSFPEAVEDLIRQGGNQTGYRTRFRCDANEDDFEGLTKIEKTLLYRIVQESVNNIIKHSEASKVRCLLSKRDGKLHITVADNGRGFETANIDVDSRGVQYMLQRASIINANINWRPAEKETGTVVDISI